MQTSCGGWIKFSNWIKIIVHTCLHVSIYPSYVPLNSNGTFSSGARMLNMWGQRQDYPKFYLNFRICLRKKHKYEGFAKKLWGQLTPQLIQSSAIVSNMRKQRRKT